MRRLGTSAGILIVLAGCAAPARGQFGGPTAVYLEAVERRSVRQTVELPGTAEAIRRSVVSAETSGRVERVAAEEGDFVGAGKPLCEMRRLPTALQLKQAEGLLGAALADLKKMEQGYRTEEIEQAEARVKSARAANERWRLEYERTTRLLADGASTKAEMEGIEAAHRQAVEALAEAEAQWRLVKAGYRAEDVDRARAQASAQQAAADQLRDALEKMTVAMPFDGFVVGKRTEVGEWVRAGDAVAEVVDLSVVRVRLDVPERYIGGVEKGSATAVMFESLGDVELKGTVSQVVPLSASGTHTVPVRVDIANPMEGGRPMIAAGLFARAWLPVGKAHEALLVPKAGVIRQGGRDLVYTVSDAPPPEAAEMLARMAEMAEKMGGGAEAPKEEKPLGPPQPPMKYAVAVPIRILRGHGRYMEVESDRLKEGMPVVTRGTYLLFQGAPVQVREKEGGSAGSKEAGKAGGPGAQAPGQAAGATE